jgi:predicted DNA-binding transcriptional regulator AlpA
MKDFETLTVEDIRQIFKLSRVSIYRRLREARAGRGGLPLPIPTGPKQRLLWNAEDVRKFLHNNETPQTPPTLEIESAKSRQKRHAEAMKKLERFGIKAPQKGQE